MCWPLFPGALIFASTLVNQRIVDDGLRVASGAMAFSDYFPWLALLVATMVLPPVIDLFIFSYITSRSQMILNTDYKGEMLQKLGRVKYEHFENSQSVEIIDKATSRAMNSARHLYPMYLFNALSGAVASIGLLWQLGQAKWWLILTTLIPFALQRWYDARHSYNIYDELEHYWNKERRYSILAGFLKSRDYLYEGKLNASSDFLIETYRNRLHARNKEYEKYYFKHLKRHMLRAGSIMNLASLGNALLLLYLYSQGEISVGALVALTMMVFSSLPTHLNDMTSIITWAGYHIQFTDYYDKFFALSEDGAPGKAVPAPETFDIEFRGRVVPLSRRRGQSLHIEGPQLSPDRGRKNLHRGRKRRRQIHDDQAAARPVRAGARANPAGRQTHRRIHPRAAQPGVRAGVPGFHAL